MVDLRPLGTISPSSVSIRLSTTLKHVTASLLNTCAILVLVVAVLSSNNVVVSTLNVLPVKTSYVLERRVWREVEERSESREEEEEQEQEQREREENKNNKRMNSVSVVFLLVSCVASISV